MIINKSRRTPAKRDSTNDKRYHTYRWVKTRAIVLERDDRLCVSCMNKGDINVANVVDHIKPVTKGGAFWDILNLQSLCTPCHQSKSQSEVRR